MRMYKRKSISFKEEVYARMASVVQGTDKSLSGWIETVVQGYMDSLGVPKTPERPPLSERRAKCKTVTRKRFGTAKPGAGNGIKFF